MTEYINANDLENFRNDLMDKFLFLCDYNDYRKITLLTIGEIVDRIYAKYYSKPLADVVEVRNGELEVHLNSDGALNHYECPVCHKVQGHISNYCEDCGAKMDGKGDSE